MTLQAFEKAVQNYVPAFHIRQGRGDIVGAFVNNNYLFRLNKGELHLMSWRTPTIKTERGIAKSNRRRGRMQSLQILVNMRWLNSKQAQQIMWGIE